MIKVLISAFIPLVLLIISITPVLLVRYVVDKKARLKRTPLTSLLLRGPGYSLSKALDEVNDEVQTIVAMLAIMPLFLYSYYVAVLYSGFLKNSIIAYVQFFLFISCIEAYILYKLYIQITKRNRLRLGLDAEMAVGQELNQLMSLGCKVFHDFPAEDFNIDHVLIGPNGVFAVETKGRAKPDKNRGAIDAKVVYDGQCLKFPDWQEAEPIQQAKRQAVWLSKWLSNVVGEQVPVKPVLALPGWYVERSKKDDLYVINGKNPLYLASPQDHSAALSTSAIQRIAAQVEQRCRDVEATAYKKEKKSLANK